MATERELVQSTLKTIAAALGVDDKRLNDEVVRDILTDMAALADDLKEALG